MKDTQRKCPNCKKIITHANKYDKKYAEKKNSNCFRCSITKPKSKEHKEKIGKAILGKKRSKETIDKLIKTKTELNQFIQSGDKNIAKRPDVRKKISENNSMKNPIHRKTQKLACENRDNKKISESTKQWWVELKKDEQKYNEFIHKRIDAYTKKLANGDYTISSNIWKTGYFIKKSGEKEWYDSSLELTFMVFLDQLDIEWTKRHKIRIPYINKINPTRHYETYYIPDFLIENKILIETKGWLKEIDIIKANEAKEYCIKNNLEYMLLVGDSLTLMLDLSLLNKKYKNYEEYFKRQ